MNTTDTSNKEVTTKRFSPEYEITTSFEGDSFERRKLAELLANYIDKLKNGAVIAINGNWGEGKTWFGKHFEKFLNEDGRNHKTIYINAFEQDYIQDPFVVIAAEINSLVKDKTIASNLKEEATQIVKYLLPAATKLILSTVTKTLFGISNSDIEKALKDGADDASNWIKTQFDDYEKQKETFINYKKNLTAFCSEQKANGGQVVIFIDELDRCKPTFAVQLIERIKHLFDVPNLVFILLMNKNQLEKAIEGVYGAGTDSIQYLSKFINLTLNLPTAINHQDFSNKGKIYQFIQKELDSYNIETNYSENATDSNTSFISELTVLANIEDMSLRDIEQACMLFALANFKRTGTGLLTYLIVVKLIKPDLFKSLRNNKLLGSALTNPAVHFLDTEMRKISRNDKYFSDQKTAQEYAVEYLEALRDLHSIIENGTHKIKESGNSYRKSSYKFFGLFESNPDYSRIQSYFNEIFDLIDFPIDLQENTNQN